ncbi:two-pore potassium channel 5-like [Rosa rugosa]|uniref:two-pore potassium channel 5-like n=1 Tax=Rosa rugosa TaxID=74645 RepID=UPI002B40909D|nr:two-pore potassium channel 5-like [Rosa rugosa]
MSLVYVSLYMAFLVLLAFRVISYFDVTDGTFIDALYITSVTLFTVGFGDIAPKWSGTLLFCDMLGMFGCIIPSIYSHFVGQMADWLYQRYLSGVQSRRRRRSYLMLSVAGTILVLILSRMAAIYYFERERLRRQFHTHTSARIILDIFHLTVMTMTTIGYGDFAFASAHGRALAALWIPF